VRGSHHGSGDNPNSLTKEAEYMAATGTPEIFEARYLQSGWVHIWRRRGDSNRRYRFTFVSLKCVGKEARFLGEIYHQLSREDVRI
jgi:hypothetical protein